MRRGFTLIELLVVIAIIAVLVALLMPALEKARRSAETSACLVKMRQIATGMALYSNDYDSHLPTNSPTNIVAGGWCLPDGSGGTPNYDYSLHPENMGPLPGRNPTNCAAVGDARTGFGAAYTSMGHWCNKAYEYMPVPEMFVCDRWVNLNGPMSAPGDYWGYPNYYIGSVDCTYGYQYGPSLGWRYYLPLSRLMRIAQSAGIGVAQISLVGHAEFGDRWLPTMAKSTMQSETYFSGHFPHAYPQRNGSDGFLMGDMSVASLGWMEAQARINELFP